MQSNTEDKPSQAANGVASYNDDEDKRADFWA